MDDATAEEFTKAIAEVCRRFNVSVEVCPEHTQLDDDYFCGPSDESGFAWTADLHDIAKELSDG